MFRDEFSIRKSWYDFSFRRTKLGSAFRRRERASPLMQVARLALVMLAAGWSRRALAQAVIDHTNP